IILKSYKEPVVHANTVVFLLSFDNRPILTDADFWSQYFFGDSGYYGTGSVRQYFKEVSHGTIAVQPVKETQGTKNDGIIRLNMNMNHPEFTNRFYSSSDNAMVMDTIYSMIKKVLIQADDYIDYADYDANGDGVVESKELDIILIFAGYEDAYVNGAIPNTTYSAQVRFYERSIQLDSVAMSQAIMTAELSPIIDAEIPVNTMGAICHEMGHGMGLPDLYDTDYSSEGLAFHSLMAGGSYNYYDGEIGSLPPPLMAWSLVELGALEPEEVTSDGIFYLWRRSSENYNVIKIPTQDGYYLIENVDFEGYGQGLSLYVEEPGVAIWYIDENVLDSLYATARFAVNDDELIPGVRLVEPNGGRDMLSGDFDYMRVYDHYFRLSGDNKYVGSHGVIFNILDDPGEVMRVEVTIVD
ncbi:MAG: M6 family metalloprotease domain-containing protein, partial [Eubacteriales bacterium]